MLAKIRAFIFFHRNVINIKMKISKSIIETNFVDIPISDFWSDASDKELDMHRIHAYPAKFPYFIVSKAIDYAHAHTSEIKCMSDSFCGCGTTALESRRRNIDFWGYDINPVATLITKVKSEQYLGDLLEKYYQNIVNTYKKGTPEIPVYILFNERVKYWFKDESIFELSGLLNAIRQTVPKGKYQIG